MLAWAKRNWYWLAGGAAALGTVSYVIRRRRRQSAFGSTAICPSLLRRVKEGPKGEIVAYVNPVGRCQTCDFLHEAPKVMQKRIDREFDHIVQRGPSYWSMHFHPLSRQAPLWKVKVFDHRIYGVPESRGNWVRFILLRGWVKDKAGKGMEEANQIAAAQGTFKEYAARRATCTELARS